MVLLAAKSKRSFRLASQRHFGSSLAEMSSRTFSTSSFNHFTKADMPLMTQRMILPTLATSELSISICMGDSLIELLSTPLEGAGEGDLDSSGSKYKLPSPET